MNQKNIKEKISNESINHSENMMKRIELSLFLSSTLRKRKQINYEIEMQVYKIAGLIGLFIGLGTFELEPGSIILKTAEEEIYHKFNKGIKTRKRTKTLLAILLVELDEIYKMAEELEGIISNDYAKLEDSIYWQISRFVRGQTQTAIRNIEIKLRGVLKKLGTP